MNIPAVPIRARTHWASLLVLLAGTALVLLLSCETDPAGPSKPRTPATVTLAPEIVTFYAVGESFGLTATVKDEAGRVIENAIVTWASADEAVAIVSRDGLATSVANGTTKITASAGSAGGTAGVAVVQVPAAIDLVPASYTFVALGDTIRLLGAVVDKNGHAVEGVPLTWLSSDSTIATVDRDGLVTATGNGTLQIAARLPGSANPVNGSASLVVKQVPTAVAVSPKEIAFSALGDTIRLLGTATDRNGHDIASPDVEWMSSDSAVAAIDGSGLATAVGNGGAEVTLAAESLVGTVSATVGVSVAQIAKTVTLSASALMFASLGDTIRLVAAAADRNGFEVANPNLLWVSSAPAVATTDQSGLIAAIGNGEAEITATAESGTGTAAGAAVTVRQVATTLSVTPTTLAFSSLGDTLRLVVAATDGNNRPILDPSVNWVSADSAVAVVSQSGLVTATGNGTAMITAKAGPAERPVVATALVSVEQIPVSVEVSPRGATLAAIGDTIRLTGVAVDGNGHPVHGSATVAWVSSSPAVATVDDGGLVTAKGNGKAEIRATARAVTGAVTGVVTVTIAQVPVSLALVPRDIAFSYLGETTSLTAVWADRNGNPLAGPVAAAWVSSDPAVAAVDDAGRVTANGTGAATITVTTLPATDSALTASAKVVVRQIPADASLSAPRETMTVGESVQVTAIALDAGGSPIPSAAFSWSSSAPSILSVDGHGLVHALRQGSAEIVAALDGLSASVTLFALLDPGTPATTAAAYLTQAIQSQDGGVPLVAGREALLRVFPTATSANKEDLPPVRAEFFRSGTKVHTVTIPRGGGPIPTKVEEGKLATSANEEIPGSIVQPGLEMVVYIDPDGTTPADLGVQARIPETGRTSVAVLAVPDFGLKILPLLWTKDPDYATAYRAERITSASDPLLHLAVDALPINGIDVEVLDRYWTDANRVCFFGYCWPDGVIVLFEVLLLRASHGYTASSGPNYAGILRSDKLGLAFVGGRSMVTGPDEDVIAHELGHNFNLLHSPCGGPSGADPNFPNANGEIDGWGYSQRSGALVDPATPDVMSYCRPRWVGAYNFEKALRYRNAEIAGMVAAGLPSPPVRSLMVWGRVDADGKLILNPSFVLDAPPNLPQASGPYRLSGRDANGTALFSLDFDMDPVADGGQAKGFVFSVPVRDGWAETLSRLSLTGPEGSVELDRDGGDAMTLLLDAAGNVRGLLRSPPTAPDGTISLPEPGLRVQVSRGIPGVEAWRRSELTLQSRVP